MQMNPVGLSFGRQAIVHLKSPEDKEKVEKFTKIYISDKSELLSDERSIVVTPKNQKVNKNVFLNEDAPFLNRLIGEGFKFTYTNKECDFDSKGNPYLA